MTVIFKKKANFSSKLECYVKSSVNKNRMRAQVAKIDSRVKGRNLKMYICLPLAVIMNPQKYKSELTREREREKL